MTADQLLSLGLLIAACAVAVWAIVCMRGKDGDDV